MSGDLTESMIESKAAELRAALRQQLVDEQSAPPLSCSYSEVTGTVRYDKDIVALVYKHNTPDGRSTTEHCLFAQTPEGYRYMTSVPSEN